jgi:RHS repeat-associated protein
MGLMVWQADRVARRASCFFFLAALLWCLPALAIRPDFQETRVGGCEVNTSGQTSVAGSKTLEMAMGCGACGYKSASGQWSWLNRDPIQEWGGINLYRFDYNSPINYFDPDGLTPFGQQVGASVGAAVGGIIGGVIGGGGGAVGGGAAGSVVPVAGTAAGAIAGGTEGAVAGAAIGGSAGAIGGAYVGDAISDLWNAMTGGKRGWEGSNPNPDKAAADKAKGRDRATGKCDRPPQAKPEPPTPPDPLRGKFPDGPFEGPPKDGEIARPPIT